MLVKAAFYPRLSIPIDFHWLAWTGGSIYSHLRMVTVSGSETLYCAAPGTIKWRNVTPNTVYHAQTAYNFLISNLRIIFSVIQIAECWLVKCLIWKYVKGRGCAFWVMSPELYWRKFDNLRKCSGDIWCWKIQNGYFQSASPSRYHVTQFARSGSYFNLRLKY